VHHVVVAEICGDPFGLAKPNVGEPETGQPAIEDPVRVMYFAVP
jgi:hypothetical protein